jgi:HK97 family phage major capsid protein
MTTPLPSPPAVSSRGFQGVLVPPEVQARIINLLIENAAFADSLTRVPTATGSVAFPVAAPSGAAWIAELAQIPLMSLNDRADVVAVAKLAGLLDISNEMMNDATINVTAAFTTLLTDSLSRQLDDGLLHGGGPPEPAGVVAVAPAVTGADLLDAVLAARGSIADAGGVPNILAASGADLAAADGARDSTGALTFPNGFAAVTGLTHVTVPALTPPLVYDSSRLYLVVRNDAMVEASQDYRFEFDATTFRVKARMACACPDPNKAIRKLEVGGTRRATGTRPAAKTAYGPACHRAPSPSGWRGAAVSPDRYWAALRSGAWIVSRQSSHGTSPGRTVNQSRSWSAMSSGLGG